MGEVDRPPIESHSIRSAAAFHLRVYRGGHDFPPFLSIFTVLQYLRVPIDNKVENLKFEPGYDV